MKSKSIDFSIKLEPLVRELVEPLVKDVTKRLAGEISRMVTDTVNRAAQATLATLLPAPTAPSLPVPTKRTTKPKTKKTPTPASTSKRATTLTADGKKRPAATAELTRNGKARQRPLQRCGKCGRPGFRSDGCGTSHEPLNVAGGAEDLLDDDRDEKRDKRGKTPPKPAKTGGVDRFAMIEKSARERRAKTRQSDHTPESDDDGTVAGSMDHPDGFASAKDASRLEDGL